MSTTNIRQTFRRYTFRTNSGISQLETFRITAETLAKLHDPKNLDLLRELGGTTHLLHALHSNPTMGLRASDTKAIPSWPSFGTVESTTTDKPSRADLECGELSMSYRRRWFGNNSLPTRKQPNFIQLMWIAYNDRVLFFLTAAALVSLSIGLYQTLTSDHDAVNPPIEWVNGTAVLAAVAIIVLVVSVNDLGKRKHFKALNRRQLEREAKVIRSGATHLMPATEIVVGDVVHVDPGDIIPADGILIGGHGILCSETVDGRSQRAWKTPGDEAIRAPDSRNGAEQDGATQEELDPFMVAGSRVWEGVGQFLVTATGIRSTQGRLLARLDHNEETTPLQARLAKLAKHMIYVGAIASGVLFFTLLTIFLANLRNDHRSSTDKGQSAINILIIALTVLVIAMPEGVALAATLALAYGTTRMLKEDHLLVRQLKACETMGNATSICTDRVGLLTQNRMTVVAGVVGAKFGFFDRTTFTDISPSADPFPSSFSGTVCRLDADFNNSLHGGMKEILIKSIALNTTAIEMPDGCGFIVGSNMESALLNFAKEHLRMQNVENERRLGNIVQIIPFKADNRCMACIVRVQTSPASAPFYRVFVKGAPKYLLEKCSKIVDAETVNPFESPLVANPLDAGTEEMITKTIAKFASRGFRTMAMVSRDLKPSEISLDRNEPYPKFSLDEILEDLVFLSVVAMHDPLRPGVQDSVANCNRAGATVRMITGDSHLTATTFAEQCGIFSPGSGHEAMDAADFRRLTELELDDKLPKLRVLAAARPQDKERLVTALRARGEIVAVTGYSISDVAAMSSVDVSFSMGSFSGTEVAREASSIILKNDDFGGIVRAIEWGRVVNDSVKKFLQFQISITITTAIIAFVSAISNADGNSVLTPVQLMWVNLFQDMGALALATDRPQPSILDRKPERRNAPLITTPMWKTIIASSAYQLAVTFTLYFAGPRIFPYGTDAEVKRVQTLVFNTYVWMQVALMYNCRQYDNNPKIFAGILRNRFFALVSATMIGIQVLIMWVGGRPLSVTRINGVYWGISLILGLLVLPIGLLTRQVPDEPLDRAADALKTFICFWRQRRPPAAADP